MQRLQQSSSFARPSLQISNQEGAALPLNFAAPPPRPVQTFPCNGVTPPHPHPVAPFPPPPHTHGSLLQGPIPPPPFPQQRPFYTLGMTHLPPTVHPRPLPHPLPAFQFPSPHFPAQPTATPTSCSNARSVSPIRPRPLPLQPVPLRFPYPTTISVTCHHCGNNLLVDLSASHLTNYRAPPPLHRPPPPPQSGGPLFWKLPLARPQSSQAPPTQTSVSTSSALLCPQGAHLSSLCRPSSSRETLREGERAGYRPRKHTTSTHRASPKTKRGRALMGVTSRGVTGIIPYRERRKEVSVETHARQQLELEFAGRERPTVNKMGEVAARLGVSRDFVRQWFSSRRQRQQQNDSSEGAELRSIPSGTHDITVEVPLTEPIPENEVQTVLLQRSPK